MSRLTYLSLCIAGSREESDDFFKEIKRYQWTPSDRPHTFYYISLHATIHSSRNGLWKWEIQGIVVGKVWRPLARFGNGMEMSDHGFHPVRKNIVRDTFDVTINALWSLIWVWCYRYFTKWNKRILWTGHGLIKLDWLRMIRPRMIFWRFWIRSRIQPFTNPLWSVWSTEWCDTLPFVIIKKVHRSNGVGSLIWKIATTDHVGGRFGKPWIYARWLPRSLIRKNSIFLISRIINSPKTILLHTLLHMRSAVRARLWIHQLIGSSRNTNDD